MRRELGRTGLKIAPLVFGGNVFGWTVDQPTCARLLERFVDGGLNAIDTADVYSRWVEGNQGGESETMIGQWLQGSPGRSRQVVLITKVGAAPGSDGKGLSAKSIAAGVEASLRRLRTDHIDLFQLHRPDPDTDIDETLGALTDLVASGKVRAVGTSTFQAEEIVEALWCADRRGHVRLRCEQPPYNIFVRGPETAVLPTCRRHGMGVITYSPLNGGWLTGRYRRGREIEQTTRTEHMPKMYDPAQPAVARKLDLVEGLLELAAQAGISLTHMALGFITANPQVTAAIIGARTVEHLDDQLAAMEIRLGDDVLDRIDELVPPGTTVDPVDAGYRTPGDVAHWNERVVRRDGVSFGSAG
jgi:aryl-alcohol dehydrogenase-like predicted oxidoreductase